VQTAHPEIDIEIAGMLEFSVADLECHSHFVILVKLFMEAFTAVCSELDVMCGGRSDQAAYSQQAG